ncbi:MAG: SOS response-associated peptidase [Actinomycetia bacterium]|nr:SOS response-associated peptidase [Actinomycetes bacterium]
MCGRYAASRNQDDLVEEFEVDRVEVREPLAPDFNVAPTKDVYAVLTRHARDRPAESPAVRQLRVVRWGLVPPWAPDPAIGNRMINARVETVDVKPAFRQAFARRRCLLPADGYYEWYAEEGRLDARGRPRKQPFFIHRRDGGVLAMAGLYEFWRDPERPHDDPAAWLTTTVVITADATDDLGRIHDRMPMVVARPDWAAWLDPDVTDGAAVKGLLRPAASAVLEAYPVSPAVGNPRNNGPGLVEPLPLDDAGGDDGGLFPA